MLLFQVGLAIVDDCRTQMPPQYKDKFGKNDMPLDVSSAKVSNKLIGSASQLVVDKNAKAVSPRMQRLKNLKGNINQKMSYTNASLKNDGEDIEKAGPESGAVNDMGEPVIQEDRSEIGRYR